MIFRARFLAVAAPLFWSCAQPPSEELAIVGERIEAARAADAEVFAPELLSEAESRLAEAEQRVRRESDHRGALRAAAQASLAAEEAVIAARSAREIVLRRFERLQDELRALLEMAAARGADTGELRAFRERCDHVEAIARNGDILLALGEAAALKPELVAFEQRHR